MGRLNDDDDEGLGSLLEERWFVVRVRDCFECEL